MQWSQRDRCWVRGLGARTR